MDYFRFGDGVFIRRIVGLRQFNLSTGAADCARCQRGARRSDSTRAKKFCEVNKCGARSAACNWVRSGDTAVILAPDWTADWLHREASAIADIIAQREYGARLDDLNELQRAYVTAAVRVEMRTNTHDPSDNSITVSAERARAMATVGAHYYGLFGGDTAPYLKLRKQMAIAANVRLPAEQARALSAFFFWTSWGASTNRPGQEITYTSNWPHEKLVGNTPTAPVFLWSLASIVLLLGGIGALCWYYVRQYDAWRDDLVPQFGVAKSDFFAEIKLTPSMRATLKYFATVIALIVVQISLGAITAHYAVDGREFYGFAHQRLSSLCRHPHLACSSGVVLDCNRVACGRVVSGAVNFRA